MLLTKQLDALRCVDMNAVDKETLVDMSGVALDTSLPHDQRLAWMLGVSPNPYCFRYGDVDIKIEFAESAPSLQEAFSSFLLKLKSGL